MKGKLYPYDALREARGKDADIVRFDLGYGDYLEITPEPDGKGIEVRLCGAGAAHGIVVRPRVANVVRITGE